MGHELDTPQPKKPNAATDGEPETKNHSEHTKKCGPVTVNVNQTIDNPQQAHDRAPKPYRDWHDILGIILLSLTFAAAVVAAIAAFMAAVFTNDVVRATKETSASQIRAYVFARAYPRVNNPKSPHTGLPIRNSGQTPAIDFSLRAQIILGDERAVPSPTEAVFENTPPRKIHAILDPSTTTSSFPFIEFGRPLRDDEIAAVEKGELRFFVYGALSYRDVLKEPHGSYFCFVYGGWGPSPDKGMGTTSQHFCDTPDPY